jgi:hypothetical protein
LTQLKCYTTRMHSRGKRGSLTIGVFISSFHILAVQSPTVKKIYKEKKKGKRKRKNISSFHILAVQLSTVRKLYKEKKKGKRKRKNISSFHILAVQSPTVKKIYKEKKKGKKKKKKHFIVPYSCRPVAHSQEDL